VFQGVWTDFVKGASRPLQCCDTCLQCCECDTCQFGRSRADHAQVFSGCAECHIDYVSQAGWSPACWMSRCYPCCVLTVAALYSLRNAVLPSECCHHSAPLRSRPAQCCPRNAAPASQCCPRSAALAVLPSLCCCHVAALTPTVQADVIDNPFCFSSLILFNINLNK
jgi:hypothetical protein